MSLPQPPAGGAPWLRRGVLAASALLATAALTACGAGHDAASLEIKPDNPATSAGGIEIHNGVVIVPEGESAAVAVSASLTNNTPKAQTLESVTVEGLSGPLELSGPDGEGDVTVPAGATVVLGGEGNPSAVAEGASGSAEKAVGSYRTVTFTFSESGKVPLEANVVADEDYYAPFAATAEASPPAAGESGSPEGEEGHEEPAAGESEQPGGDHADEGEQGGGEESESSSDSAEGSEGGASAPASPDASQSTGAADEQH
ncbi:hypothetical protein [Streptomyces capparidis]